MKLPVTTLQLGPIIQRCQDVSKMRGINEEIKVPRQGGAVALNSSFLLFSEGLLTAVPLLQLLIQLVIGWDYEM